MTVSPRRSPRKSRAKNPTMEPVLRKEDAVSAFGTSIDLAARLGITRAAVANWPWNKPIPTQRTLQLLELYPRRIRPLVKMVPIGTR